jgi:hypothetical protein
VKLDFAGLFQVDSEELIAHDPESRRFKSNVYSNMSPVPLSYDWDVKDGSMTITVSHGPLDATFKRRARRGRQNFLRRLASQSWRGREREPAL